MRRTWVEYGILCALCVGTQVGGKRAFAALRYQRGEIFDGEVWRVLTGHLVHTNWPHLAMNLVVGAVIVTAVGRCLRPLVSPFLICATGVSAGLLLFLPRLEWYAGLSGVLHGLLACGALRALRGRPIVWGAVLVLLATKLVWEMLAGPRPGLEETIGAPVIFEAHLFGVLAGALAWALLYRKAPQG